MRHTVNICRPFRSVNARFIFHQYAETSESDPSLLNWPINCNRKILLGPIFPQKVRWAKLGKYSWINLRPTIGQPLQGKLICVQ